MSKNENNFFTLTFVVFILFLILYITDDYKINQILLCIIFFYTTTLSFIGKKFNFYQIFLGFLFLFLIIKPFMNLFGLYSFPEGNTFFISSLITQEISNESMIETFKVISIFLLGSSLGWLIYIFFIKTNKIIEINNPIKINRIFNLLIIILSYLFYFYLIYLINQYGYKQVVHAKILSNNFYLLYHVINILYPLYFIILLYNSDSPRVYVKNAILFLLPLFFVSFFGSRGIFVMNLIIIIYFYNLRYDLKNFNKIFVILIFTFIIFSTARIVSNSFSQISFTDIFFLDAFLKTGNSLGVIGYTIEFVNNFENKYPFFIGFIVDIFSNYKNYTYEAIEYRSNLAQHLSFILNKKYFYSGATIGSSVVAEIYELANGIYIYIFLLAAIIIFLSGLLSRIFLNNILSFYFCFYYFSFLFASPRGSIMKIFNKSFLIGFILILTYFILQKFFVFYSHKK